MTSVWLATNGGSGEDGDEWLLFDIFATEEAANAHVAEENARRGFMEVEVEEWSVKGSPLTDEERGVLRGLAEDASYRCADFTERVVRGLLERLK
jgi:hypothetical protein